MYVSFTVAARTLVADLGEVREVVRTPRVERLPGCTPPVVGAIEVRGVTVPVADARPDVSERACDVLLLQRPARSVLGVIVDRVLAVEEEGEWGQAQPAPEGLPSYVTGLLAVDGEVRSVVDLHALATAAAQGRAVVAGQARSDVALQNR